MKQWTLGADPELFLRRIGTQELLPVCGLIGGTKEKPLPIEGLGRGFAVQEDNVMLEFNIPASTSAGAFADNIAAALTSIFNTVKTKFEAEIVPSSGIIFPAPLLATASARMFGCSPDFDAYTMGAKHAPIDPVALADGAGEWRFAGGHIHIGYDSSVVPPFAAAMFADLFMGLPSVSQDKQGKRRELYGKAGRFRPTSYGFEYRTLSNFWLFNEGLTHDIAYRAERLASFLNGRPQRDIEKIHGQMPWDDIKTAINSEDVRLAGDIIQYSRDVMQRGE